MNPLLCVVCSAPMEYVVTDAHGGRYLFTTDWYRCSEDPRHPEVEKKRIVMSKAREVVRRARRESY